MEVGKAGFEWADRAKFTKVGGKWKRKKRSVTGLRRGDERSGRGERTERKRLAVDTYYLTLYNIPRSDQNC